MNEHGQAVKGGERGINGEWYEGGQFMPSSETTIKGAYKPVVRKGTKKEIAPYIWEAAPADDMLSIYDRLQYNATDNRRECQYIKGQGLIGFKFVEAHKTYFPVDGKYPQDYDNKRGCWKERANSAEWMAFMNSLIEKFNKGERWYPLSDDPFHYKNQK